MLTEQRYEQILRLLEQKKSITVTEVKELLNTSESTVRRDITALHNAGKLVKVFGGAVAADNSIYTAHELTVAQKLKVNQEEKRRIAKYAASLIAPEDFVYLDAGTTTGYMLEYIAEKNVTFVTNAVAHAQRLLTLGNRVFLVGGELKASTEAIVGSQAMQTLASYHFTKGFFGTNGVTKNTGFTTPDVNEALVKKLALNQCRKRYVLCDTTKFGNVSSVTFGDFEDADIISERLPEGYEGCKNVLVVSAPSVAFATQRDIE